MEIGARNNLNIPIHLTLTNSGNRILITVGEGGTNLRDFYRVCIDANLSPNRVWEDVGSLEIENEYKLSICGKEAGNNEPPPRVS